MPIRVFQVVARIAAFERETHVFQFPLIGVFFIEDSNVSLLGQERKWHQRLLIREIHRRFQILGRIIGGVLRQLNGDFQRIFPHDFGTGVLVRQVEHEEHRVRIMDDERPDPRRKMVVLRGQVIDVAAISRNRLNVAHCFRLLKGCATIGERIRHTTRARRLLSHIVAALSQQQVGIRGIQAIADNQCIHRVRIFV